MSRNPPREGDIEARVRRFVVASTLVAVALAGAGCAGGGVAHRVSLPMPIPTSTSSAAPSPAPSEEVPLAILPNDDPHVLIDKGVLSPLLKRRVAEDLRTLASLTVRGTTDGSLTGAYEVVVSRYGNCSGYGMSRRNAFRFVTDGVEAFRRPDAFGSLWSEADPADFALFCAGPRSLIDGMPEGSSTTYLLDTARLVRRERIQGQATLHLRRRADNARVDLWLSAGMDRLELVKKVITRKMYSETLLYGDFNTSEPAELPPEDRRVQAPTA